MREITKKDIDRIKEGYHDTLMEAIEFLIDTYDEDKFNDGYKSCLEDLAVRSYRLADYIVKHTTIGNEDAKRDDFTPSAVNDLSKVIEDYYIEELEKE